MREAIVNIRARLHQARCSSHALCGVAPIDQRTEAETRGALLLLNTTRTRSGPPSTRATITMDGGVADTARANTETRMNTGR